MQVFSFVRAVFSRAVWFSICLSAPVTVMADLVVGVSTSETITDLVLAPWGTESFAISTTNSPVNCAASNGWVIFTKSNMSSPEAYDRAYSLALTAMSSNQPVVVDALSGSDCTTAYMLAVGALYQ